jgi:hypothetical protein
LPVVPLPVEPLPVEELPVEPLPVLPIAPPAQYPHIPPQVLRESARPGIISAIGTSSIVVAAICMLSGFVMMLINLVVSSAARFPTPVPAGTAIAKSSAPGPAELLGPNSTAAVDRAAIVDGISHLRALTEPQKQNLDELLAEEGKSILPLSGPDITREQVAANITREGHLSAGGGTGTEYFVLGNGRLELTDDQAVFFPGNGQPSIRAKAIHVPAGSGGFLQPDQMRSIIRAIERNNGTKIKSAQATVIVQTLQGPGQQLIVPTADGSDPATEVTSVTTDPDDASLTISTHHGNTDSTISMDSAGAVTSTASNSITITGGGAATSVTFNRTASQWVSFLSIAQEAIAVYLLICGIFTLRNNSFAGRRLHWIYLIVKLPVGIAACGTLYWLWNGFFTAQAVTNPSTSPLVSLWFVAPAAIGLIYPIVLLFVLLVSKGVRSYFSNARYAA